MAQQTPRIRNRFDKSGRLIESFTDLRRGPGNCEHYKFAPAVWVNTAGLEPWGYRPGMEYVPSQWESGHMSVPPELLRSLNRSKLPSTTEAGLLQIIAELDDTIAMFALKFWKKLSYGSLTWGVMPFVQDVQAILKAIQNMDNLFKNIQYEDQIIHKIPDREFPFYSWNGSPYLIHRLFDGEVKVRFTGSVDMEQVNSFLQSMDFLGLHPDLATAWDLVPLSFIIDYFVPIGSFLESFQGWVRSVPFKGWTTVKTSYKFEEVVPPAPWWGRPHGKTTTGMVKRFVRYNRPLTLTVPPFSYSPELPSLIQLFNTLYVLRSRK